MSEPVATYNGAFDGWQSVTIRQRNWFSRSEEEVAENGDEWGMNKIAWKDSKTLVVSLDSDFAGKTTDWLEPKWRGISIIVRKDVR